MVCKRCRSLLNLNEHKIDRPVMEECDDGNSFSGDGCSPNCQVERHHGGALLSLSLVLPQHFALASTSQGLHLFWWWLEQQGVLTENI